MKRQRYALALLAMGLSALPAGALCAELADYVGEWRGTGQFERTTSGKQRKGRLTCRLTIKAESAGVIVINGRCAAPEGSRGFGTRVTELGGGKLKGEELKGTGARHNRVSAGTLGGGGLHLEGSDALGTFMFALGAPTQGRIDMRSSARDAKKSEAAHVGLRRSR